MADVSPYLSYFPSHYISLFYSASPLLVVIHNSFFLELRNWERFIPSSAFSQISLCCAPISWCFRMLRFLSIWGILCIHTEQAWNATRLVTSCSVVSGCTRFRAILTDGKALQLYSSALKCQPPHLTDQSSLGKILANLKSDIIAELLLKTSCASSMGILSVCLILHLYKLCHKMFEWKVFVSGIFANGAILFPWAKLLETSLGRNL